MAQKTSNSLFQRLMTWLNMTPAFSMQEQFDLKASGDSWTGAADPKLNKTVHPYSY